LIVVVEEVFLEPIQTDRHTYGGGGGAEPSGERSRLQSRE
jgi:hypothetical protein